MESHFVKVQFDIDCAWEGLQPAYRVYVNDELFTERTWQWTSAYLEETLQLHAPPGQYRIKIETVKPALAVFNTKNYTVTHGPARMISNQVFEIF